MMSQWSSLAVAAALLVSCLADENIILPALSSQESLPEKMLVLIPGGKVPNVNYVETAKAIQKEATEFRLWVVIPGVFQRLCIISCTSTYSCSPLHGQVESALSEATKQGWKRAGKDDDDVFLAGHSLGGVCSNTLFQAYSSGTSYPYAGVILMGSYVDETGAHDLVHYPKPVLHLNAELDGLTRPGKTAIWWSQHLQLRKSLGEEEAMKQKPVVILAKQNHSNFCPGFDVEQSPGDLMGEVSQAEATATIGASVAAFLTVHSTSVPDGSRTSALALIKAKIAATAELMTPYLTAQAMEHDPSNTKVSAEGASSFCANAQKVIGGLSSKDNDRLVVTDGFRGSSLSLESCLPNSTSASSGLATTTCSHTDYYADIDNLGFITASSEIACKMLSSDRLAQQLETEAEDSNVDCQAVNRYSVALAEKMALARTLDRFKRNGKGWCFLDDFYTTGNIVPVWVFKNALALKEGPKCMSVQSPALKTEANGGSHYCKFLTPTRVLDWMMTDSLRKPSKTFADAVIV